ncbi:MAG: GNAT family N-acetyltransferase [Acetatifactor sp.]|nr:GNAT family N-acetyltransferase [Acetatifactor sp.]
MSCTDAPGMSYMAEDVQEIGIHTLQEYRGRGYALTACSKCIQEILNHHKVPMWSTTIGNTASRKLAEKIGFAEFAEVIYITF